MRKEPRKASLAFFSSSNHRRLSLAEIDAVVSARLGATRVPGNAQPACFNRQVAMYLAKHVGGWSTTCIGRFYNGRDHSTVIHGIQRIEALGESDPDIDALLSELKDQLNRSYDDDTPVSQPSSTFLTAELLSMDELAENIAERVWSRLAEQLRRGAP